MHWYLLAIINWVFRALNADWLKAVVYQTLYHGYEKIWIFTVLMSNKAPLGFVVYGQYTTTKGLYPGIIASYMRKALSRVTLAIAPTPLRPYCLNKPWGRGRINSTRERPSSPTLPLLIMCWKPDKRYKGISHNKLTLVQRFLLGWPSQPDYIHSWTKTHGQWISPLKWLFSQWLWVRYLEIA